MLLVLFLVLVLDIEKSRRGTSTSRIDLADLRYVPNAHVPLGNEPLTGRLRPASDRVHLPAGLYLGYDNKTTRSGSDRGWAGRLHSRNSSCPIGIECGLYRGSTCSWRHLSAHWLHSQQSIAGIQPTILRSARKTHCPWHSDTRCQVGPG